MAVNTVNAQGYDAIAALGTVTAAAAGKTADSSSQSFGDALNKAGDKIMDKSSTVQSTDQSKNSEQQKTQVSENKQAEQKPDDSVENAEQVQNDQNVAEEKPTDKIAADKPQENASADEEPVDKMTMEQIADALMQIIEQLKQLCGVSDEEILAGMKNIGIQPTDLLNADNMAQLLAEIAGEGEVISLVTNEDLYAALQELTTTVEAISSQLTKDTGLTQEELDAVLEKLNQMEEPLITEMVPEEGKGENGPMTSTVNHDTAESQEELPIVLVEEVDPNDTKQVESKVAQKQFDNVSETQQTDLVTETQTRPRTQKPEQDAHEQKNSTNDFNGQQQSAQNFDNKLNEAQTAAETTTRYTSENTESILRQLADVVKIIKNENLTQMELQLHPASLGTVHVSLVTKGGAVTAEFTTQNEAVRAAIESQVSQLMTNLEEQGVKVEAVEVSVGSHEMERNLDENSHDEQSKKEQEEEQRVRGTRRNSINFNSFADDGELIEEMQGADDATRIAMEMMAANGNSMDLMV